ncbi:MAG: hypothetical protein JSS66_07160 [Armatimonadetes bacterium]|nr:hypothetical protein [Armatimonadota bacterium]
MNGYMLYIDCNGYDLDDTWEETLGVYLDEDKAKKAAHRLEGIRIARFAVSKNRDGNTLRWARYNRERGRNHEFSVFVKTIKVR